MQTEQIASAQLIHDYIQHNICNIVENCINVDPLLIKSTEEEVQLSQARMEEYRRIYKPDGISHIIIPICKDNHWFCSVITIENNLTKFCFFDSKAITGHRPFATNTSIKISNEIMKANKTKYDTGTRPV